MSNNFPSLESSLLALLETNYLKAIKAEFEAEGTRIDELAFLSQLCLKYKVPLTLKIGGACAKRDMYEAFQLGAKSILVPMIESEFSLNIATEIFEKIKPVFYSLNKRPCLSINIESKLAHQNFDSILQVIINNKLPVKSIVIGRSDLASSHGIKNVNLPPTKNYERQLI